MRVCCHRRVVANARNASGTTSTPSVSCRKPLYSAWRCVLGMRRGRTRPPAKLTRTRLPARGLAYKPTVCLDVISSVASSYGYDSGQIEPRIAHELAVHVATHGGHTARTKHLHPPRAQPIAHVRQRQGRRPLLPPMGCTDHAPHCDQGQPCDRTWEEKRPNRFTVPLDAMPARLSYFRLLALTSPN